MTSCITYNKLTEENFLSPLSSKHKNIVILYGDDNTTNAILEFYSHAKQRLDSAASSLAPSIAVGVKEVWLPIEP